MLDIMQSLSPEDLNSILGAKLIEVHDCISRDRLQEILNLASNMLDIQPVPFRSREDPNSRSLEKERPSIKVGVCQELDQLRELYDTLDEKMQATLVCEMRRIN